jgi:hypothetical protein
MDGSPLSTRWQAAPSRRQSTACKTTRSIYMAEQMTNEFLQVGFTNPGAGAGSNVMPTTVGITQKP